MKKRPRSIFLTGVLLLLSGPLLFLTEYMLEDGFQNLPLIAFAFSATVVGWGILKVRLWGYYGFLLFSAALLTYNFIHYLQTHDSMEYLSLLGVAALAGFLGFVLQRHITAPYFNPHLRWWEKDPRYPVHLDAFLTIERHLAKGQLLDISRGGCFLVTPNRLLVNEPLQLKLKWNSAEFDAMARVTWVSKDPEGYGVMFTQVKDDQRKELLKIIRGLANSQSTVTEGATTKAVA